MGSPELQQILNETEDYQSPQAPPPEEEKESEPGAAPGQLKTEFCTRDPSAPPQDAEPRIEGEETPGGTGG
jgi:hypothetical protein